VLLATHVLLASVIDLTINVSRLKPEKERGGGLKKSSQSFVRQSQPANRAGEVTGTAVLAFPQ